MGENRQSLKTSYKNRELPLLDLMEEGSCRDKALVRLRRILKRTDRPEGLSLLLLFWKDYYGRESPIIEGIL